MVFCKMEALVDKLCLAAVFLPLFDHYRHAGSAKQGHRVPSLTRQFSETLSNWKPIKLKMLDFIDCSGICISIFI